MTNEPAVNESYFRGLPGRNSYLAARGFDEKTGSRSGGIRTPMENMLEPGYVLLRTYMDPTGEYGQWWFTPHEMALVIRYFGRSGPAFAIGRTDGKGVLQATLAVRNDWIEEERDRPAQMSLIVAVRVVKSLLCFHGESDEAPSKSQTSNLKPITISADGVRRNVRQVFLPKLAIYQSAVSRIRSGLTDADLEDMAAIHDAGPYQFER